MAPAEDLPLEEAVHLSEQHLILNEFHEAEILSRSVLKRTIYDPGHGELEDRAAVVLVQALYETQRFGSVRGELTQLYGRLAACPVSALLLYLSLALDFADARAEAQALTLDLLQSRAPEGGAGWGRRQYAALAHLYFFELLVPELREPAQAARWLEETTLPLPRALRESMAEELAAAVCGAGAGDASDPDPHTRRASEGTLVDDLRRASTARAVVPRAGSGVGALAGALGTLSRVATGASSASGPPSSAASTPLAGSEAGGDGSARGSGSDQALQGWLAASARSVHEAGAAVLSSVVRGDDEGGGGGGDDGVIPARGHSAAADATLPVVAGGVLLAALAWALATRRKRLAQGAGDALRALGDLLRMGLQLSPSSMPRTA